MNKQTIQPHIIMIGLGIILLAAVVYIVGTSLQSEQRSADLTFDTALNAPSIPMDADLVQQLQQLKLYISAVDSIKSTRSMQDYWNQRAYNGAPPTIPHPILNEQSMGDSSCLQCHQYGDYSPKFEAYAPIVPHPEMINCRQCHVPINTEQLFVESNWETLPHPTLNQVPLPGGPNAIPHDFQMRENCLSCHLGPASPVEIRVPHPERLNCVQCHVQINTNEGWSR